MTTHSDDNQLAMEEKVPDDNKNRDITEDDDLLLLLYVFIIAVMWTITDKVHWYNGIKLFELFLFVSLMFIQQFYHCGMADFRNLCEKNIFEVRDVPISVHLSPFKLRVFFKLSFFLS